MIQTITVCNVLGYDFKSLAQELRRYKVSA